MAKIKHLMGLKKKKNSNPHQFLTLTKFFIKLEM